VPDETTNPGEEHEGVSPNTPLEGDEAGATEATPEPPPQPETMEEVLDDLEGQIMGAPIIDLDREKAKTWLNEFRAPIASLGTHVFVDLIRAHTERRSDEYLQALYAEMEPDELLAVVEANAADIEELAEGRAREAGLMRMAKDRLTLSMSSIIFQGLSKVLGVV